MKLGCCISSPAQLAQLESAGAGYCELPAARLMATDDGEFASLAAAYGASAVPPLAANVFLPGELKVTGPDTAPDRQDAYVEACTARLQRLGVRVLVFGSGKARDVPDGFDRGRALDQLADFMRRTAGVCGERGIRPVLEPLRRAESNVFNSVREGATFLREREIAGFFLLADLYHMNEEGEELGVVDECADLLAHVHVAGLGRRPPGPDDRDIEELFGHLRRAGYGGDCSIECSWGDFASEAGPSMDVLRESAARAGWDA
jgi:sugar phosphate isomerase/epimerase